MNEHILYAFAPQKGVQKPQDICISNPRGKERKPYNFQPPLFLSHPICFYLFHSLDIFLVLCAYNLNKHNTLISQVKKDVF